jgi:hypothetical protein
VDVDFSRRIFDENMVEGDNFAFNLEVAYKWLDFYLHCQNIGHVMACRWLIPEKDDRGRKHAHVQAKIIQK